MLSEQMHCPSDWESLLAHRFDARIDPPARWAAACAHLDHCPQCQTDAEGIDPTLLFRALPEITVSDFDVAEMQRAVSTLKASSALHPASRWQRLGERAREARASTLAWLPFGDAASAGLNAAAVRVAAAMLLVLGLGAGMVMPSGEEVDAASDLAATQAMSAGLLTGEPDGFPADWQDLSVPAEDAAIVEGVVSPVARVYTFPAPNDEVAVVMIIDPTLDV